MWHFGGAGRQTWEGAYRAAASAGHLFNDRSGWTLRVGTDGRFSVSFLLIIPDNEQTVLPAPRTLIRYARSAHFHRRKKTENFFLHFLVIFLLFILPTASNMNEVEGNSVMCVTGGFFYFIFSTFLSEKMGGEFSDFQRFIVYIYPWTGMESGRVGCMAWTAYPRRGCSTLCRLMFVKCGGTPLIFSFLFIRAAGWLPPLCAEWVVNTWYVCDRSSLSFLSVMYLVACN
jgi:hypothetical protein